MMRAGASSSSMVVSIWPGHSQQGGSEDGKKERKKEFTSISASTAL